MAEGPSTTTRTSSVRAARQGRRLNRSEQRAMEIRQARTQTSRATDDVDAPLAPPTNAPGAARARRRQETKGAVRAVALTRDQEYGFIRSDLRRLLILSAILVVGMIVVLIALESIF